MTFLLLAESVTAMDVAERFGLPVAILVVLGWWHATTVKAKDGQIQALSEARIASIKEKDAALGEKDREIARVNELRVSESRMHTEALLRHNHESIKQLDEFNSTLELLAERLPQRTGR